MTTARYLLDTNTCVAIRNSLRAKPHKDEARRDAMNRLVTRWRGMSAHDLAMSFITLGELAVYAEMNANAPKARAVFARIKQSIAVIGAAEGNHPNSAEALGHRYAEIRADLQRRGCAIGPNDMWIAAHAALHGLTVVTSDRGFANVPGLAVEDWAA